MQKTLKIQIFDFDDQRQWRRVLAVANNPLVLRALDAGMNVLCSTLETTWDRNLGPWWFSSRQSPNWHLLEASPPKSDSPNWYRITGHCNIIAPWCAAVGSLLFPDHPWYYAHNPCVPKFGCHSAGLGFKDGKTQSLIVMDILFGQQALQEGTKNQLASILTNAQSKHLPLLSAIERFERGEYTR
jgi:hypothetical protein